MVFAAGTVVQFPRRKRTAHFLLQEGWTHNFEPYCPIGRCLLFQDDQTCFQKLPVVAKQSSTNTEAIAGLPAGGFSVEEVL